MVVCIHTSILQAWVTSAYLKGRDLFLATANLVCSVLIRQLLQATVTQRCNTQVKQVDWQLHHEVKNSHPETLPDLESRQSPPVLEAQLTNLSLSTPVNSLRIRDYIYYNLLKY